MKSGYVAITGKPNVGKSSLLNCIAKKKIAITSNKPQTTRNQIKYIYRNENVNIGFVDTPGYHKQRNKLDIFLNSQIKASYKNVDCVLLLIDLTRPIDEEDREIIKWLNQYEITNTIVLLTKLDICSMNDIEQHKNEINQLITPKNIITISSKNDTNILNVIDEVSKYLSLTIELEQSDLDDKFIISETIREQIIKLTKQELPYSVSIAIDQLKYDNEKNMFHIHASIIAEKNSHKPILVGAKGQTIKKIGIASREELLKIYNCKINLQLFVKIKND